MSTDIKDAPVAGKLTAAERKQHRATLAPKFVSAVRSFSAAAVEFGREFKSLVAELEEYFTAAEVKKGELDKWIQNTCGLSRSSWKRYVQVAETLGEMDAEDVAVVSANWSVDGMTELTRLDEEQRKALVKRVGTKPSTATIKTAAESIKPRAGRNTPDAAEKTTTFAAKIREAVATHIAGDPVPMVSAIFGAQLQLDNPKENVPDALLHILSNPLSDEPNDDDANDES